MRLNPARICVPVPPPVWGFVLCLVCGDGAGGREGGDGSLKPCVSIKLVGTKIYGRGRVARLSAHTARRRAAPETDIQLSNPKALSRPPHPIRILLLELPLPLNTQLIPGIGPDS